MRCDDEGGGGGRTNKTVVVGHVGREERWGSAKGENNLHAQRVASLLCQMGPYPNSANQMSRTTYP